MPELTLRHEIDTDEETFWSKIVFDEGFNEIGRRPRYYPANMGREDAIVMAMELLPDA